MENKHVPETFRQLQSIGSVNPSDIMKTPDGFWLIYKSLSNILSENNILDFPDSDGKRLPCSRFYDDWFLFYERKKTKWYYPLASTAFPFAYVIFLLIQAIILKFDASILIPTTTTL